MLTKEARPPTRPTQVSASEKGAINGAADTVRTLSSALGFPLMTSLFGYFISDKAPFKLPGACVTVGGMTEDAVGGGNNGPIHP